MGVMETYDLGPEDLRGLDADQLRRLAEDLRGFLIEAVCRTGGHLGPNLGVVELTMALHRVFDSPETPIVFDTGHQAYVHKILTGRARGFARLRKAGGLSGYPNRAESPHDFVENSHASTALSYVDGLSKGYELTGDRRLVVAVVGDGALTGGLAWEALNNIGASGRRVLVILNDNGRSYSPTIGGLPRHLSRLVDRARYDDLIAMLGGATSAAPGEESHRQPAPRGLFTDLGFAYFGPVDGHDVGAVERVLQATSEHDGPVVVHCLTRKGNGYRPAETDPADRMHSVGVVESASGLPAKPPSTTWTDAFSHALLELGSRRQDIVAVSAAMLGPTGLQPFADEFPARCFDVGIAEQHAMTSAAGLAMAGAHPVVAIYATFANRAFDQALFDVGLHQLPVTMVFDRAGITGPDGPSHHGMWDLAMLGMVPGLDVAAPRDAATLIEELDEAAGHASGPTALRFPKAAIAEPIVAERRVDRVDVLRSADSPDVLLVSVGPLAAAALSAAETLAGLGIDCTVVDPRWVLPINPVLVDMAAGHSLVVTVEDGLRSGGVGSQLAQAISRAGLDVTVMALGLPTEFIPQGDRTALLAAFGLDGDGIAAAVTGAIAARPSMAGSLGQVPVSRLSVARGAAR